ncbi:MAG: peptidoglycan bridge formation glycyltransferase FemA/FemB family protein [Clostridia bacterium]
MIYPDVYYLPNWGKLNEKLEKGIYDEFIYDTDLGQIVYPFVKRKTPTDIDDNLYYDLITPYGFNGPCITKCNGDKLKLLTDYEEKFKLYCEQNKIIAEYIRFSPWLKNAQDFKNLYSLQDNNITFFIDLKNEDYFEKIYSSKCRNQIRKAIKSGVEVKLYFGIEKLEEFYDLYCKMLQKNDVSDYYKFQKDYIQNTIEMMQGNIVTAVAFYEDIPISASLFLYNDKYIHYHLSGNNKDYSNYCGNHLVLYEVSKWAFEKGIEEFHLGGVANDEKGLYHFKESFARDGILPFFVGKKIDNDIIYNKLVKKLNKSVGSGYFPAYRG